VLEIIRHSTKMNIHKAFNTDEYSKGGKL